MFDVAGGADELVDFGFASVTRCVETRSLPALTRSFPRRFTLITRTASCSRQLP
jgi:hypothetical protein